MSDKPYPSRVADQFVVRLPDGMRDRIAVSAEAAGRSMNAEIVARLQQSFDSTNPKLLAFENESLKKRIDTLEHAVRFMNALPMILGHELAYVLKSIPDDERDAMLRPTELFARAMIENNPSGMVDAIIERFGEKDAAEISTILHKLRDGIAHGRRPDLSNDGQPSVAHETLKPYRTKGKPHPRRK